MAQAAPPQELKLEEYKGGMSIRLLTAIGRGSYCHLAKPHPRAQGSAPVFGLTLIMSPAACSQIWEAMVILANRKWTNVGEQMLRAGQLNSPLKAGDAYFQKKTLELAAKRGMATFDPNLFPREALALAAYRGMFTINPSAAVERRPACVNVNNQPCAPEEIYSGCYARAYITLATISDVQPTKGIAAYLNSVQFVRHGDKLAGFDGGAAAQAAFASAPLPADVVAAQQPAASGSPFGGQPGPGLPASGPAPSAVPAGFAAPPSGTAPWAPPVQQAQPVGIAVPPG